MPVMQAIENYAYRVSDRVVSLLPSALEHMSSHGLAAEKFAYVPNGVDIGLFENAEPLNEETAANFPTGKFVVGYAGSIGPANALDPFVDAADMLRDREDLHFVLVGMGRDRERLQGRVRELALSNVTFIDPVPGSQVPTLLERCDALYVGLQSTPLYHFGVSPNKLFEYMYSGKPVISAIAADRDIVADAGCGLSITPDDARAAADAVLKLVATPEAERRAMGVRGRAYIAEHHSYEALASRYCDLLADGSTAADANGH
jgi:glycosyltransferase involved in cell wall biosynthesis